MNYIIHCKNASHAKFKITLKFYRPLSCVLNPVMLCSYQAPLCVEGWDEALHEIGRLSFATVLSSQNATALLKSVEDLPVLVVAGAEDALVSLKSAQAMASKVLNSVSIPAA